MFVGKVTRQAIVDEIEEGRGGHVEFLRRFVRSKSPNPPGDTREAAQVVIDYLSSYDIPFETWILKDDLPNIVADFPCDFSLSQKQRNQNQNAEKQEEKRLVMNGHMDVFPVSEDEKDSWKRDPWSGDSDGKYVYGRGVVDMKAGAAASIIAYRYLYQLHQKHYTHHSHPTPQNHVQSSPPNTPSLALTIVSDEETGGKYGSRWLLSDKENGGGGSRWKGTIMLNAEPGGLQSIRFGEKGTLRLTFHISTISAHGAYLHLSEGAIRIAARLITSLLSIEDLPFPTHPCNDGSEDGDEKERVIREIIRHMEREEVRQVVNEIMGMGASGILMRPTVNVGVIGGGAKVNVIPGECRFEVDIRIPIGMDRDVILTHVNTVILPKFPEARVEVQEAASNPPSFCAVRHEVVEGLKRNAVFVGEGKGKIDKSKMELEGKGRVEDEEGSDAAMVDIEGRGGLTGFTPVEISGIGATDCKFWRYAGIPAYTYGPSPKTQGSRDEKGEIEEFIDVLKTHVLTAWEFLGGSEDE